MDKQKILEVNIKKNIEISIGNLFKKAALTTSVKKKRVQQVGFTGDPNEKSTQTKISGAIKALFDDDDLKRPTKVEFKHDDDKTVKDA